LKEIISINELGDIVTGKTPKTKIKNNYGGEFLFITPNDLASSFLLNKTERTLSRRGLDEVANNSIRGLSVLVDCIGSNLGNVAIVDKECVTNQQINSITNFKHNVNPYYIYFWFTNKKTFLQRIAGGTSLPIINKSHFSKLKIELPEKPIQDEIVNKLLVFERKMALNNQLVSELEEYSQLLFRKWFVDFNFPNEGGKPYTDSGGELKEVAGKKIPKNWEIKELNNLALIKTDSIDPGKNPEELFSYYDIPTFDVTRLFSLVQGKRIASNKYAVTKKNILVSKLNPWFKRVVYPYKLKEGICSTEFVVWEPIEERNISFLYVIATSDRFTNYLTNAASGTSNSHKRVQPQYMMKYEIAFNEKIINEYSRITQPLIEKIHALIVENTTLKETRNLLIHKLIK